MLDEFEGNETLLKPISIKDGINLDTSVTTESSYRNTDVFLEEDQIRNGSRQDASILSCLLCLVVVSLYQKINFLLKLCLMTLTAIVQIVIYTCISKSSSPTSIKDATSISPLNASITSTVEDEHAGSPNTSALVGLHPSAYSEWPLWLEPLLLMSLFIVLLHLLDRQIEIMSRSDFLWMTKLKSEEEGGDTTLGINKVNLLIIFDEWDGRFCIYNAN